MSKQFHLGDIVSITTGYLMSPRLIEGVYDILNHMTQDDLHTVALGRAATECKPYIYEQLPFTKTLEFGEADDKFQVLGEWIKVHGEYHALYPMHFEDHEVLHPIEDLYRIDPSKADADIIVLSLDDEEDDISPFGDINWK